MVLLGFQIDKNGVVEDSMLKKLEAKIKNTAKVWARYYLSLPGKIAVAKTLMFSQLSFPCSIILPPDEWINNIQKVIDNFCISGLNVAKERFYKSPENG